MVHAILAPNKGTLAASIVLSSFALNDWVMPAYARDTVPSNRAARAYHLKTFPPVAPRLLLPDRRGRQYRTVRLRVPLSGCHKTPVENICGFHILLKRKKGVPKAYHAPIACRGELWSKHRSGVGIVARVGNYVCRTV